MPEFILDHGSPETARQFRNLDSFTQGYIEAMFFTDEEQLCEESGQDRESYSDDQDRESYSSGHVTVADLAPETLARIVADCERFQTANAAMIEAALELVPKSERFRYAKEPLDDRRLGQLFWYTRCGHGVSFTDDGNAQCLFSLEKAAQLAGNVDSYVGDDGLIYLS